MLRPNERYVKWWEEALAMLVLATLWFLIIWAGLGACPGKE